MSEKDIQQYGAFATKKHRDAYGQHFTPKYIAEFMTKWIMQSNPCSILDPAVGNNAFFSEINLLKKDIFYCGYEIDKQIYDFFLLDNEHIKNADFMTNDWEMSFDAVIANPPYSKFQNIQDRKKHLEEIYNHTLLKLSGQSNYCLYFFVKSLYQLNNGGRLAFIMPYDFLDGVQGLPIKRYLVENKLLNSIIFLKYDNVFEDVITTAAIFLIEKNNNSEVSLITYDSKDAFINRTPSKSLKLHCNDLQSIDKWSNISQELKDLHTRTELPKLGEFINVRRGIATGCNNFFILNDKLIEKFAIPSECYCDCITSSTQIDVPFLTEKDFSKMAGEKKLLTVNENTANLVQKYIFEGEEKGCNASYLAKHRNNWYELEKQIVPDMLFAATTRNQFKIIRSLISCKYLTSFHGIYVFEKYKRFTNAIFCYLQTDLFKSYLKSSQREIGHGLKKLQPNDIKNISTIDFNLLINSDIEIIENIYWQAQNANHFENSQIEKLNSVYAKYIV